MAGPPAGGRPVGPSPPPKAAAYGRASKAPLESKRLRREERTLVAMVAMYCRDHHGAVPPCPDCAALLDYARAHLERCPYEADKPTCAKCRTHCYKPAMRDRVRAVMRHSGPRMLKEHPLMAAAHLIDGRRRPPARRPG